MSTHKNIDKICCIVLALTLILTAVFMNAEAFGVGVAKNSLGYESRLFDTSRVHTVDIVMNDWDSFIDTCMSEEYAYCSVIIDGEAYKNIAIRAKGNTSLSQVSSSNSDRYSFKIEFDHYDSSSTYYGLDKLCLNNIIQDNTYMKDYLTYTMMNDFGVASPLCSYAYLTVNGEDWGLYLAVEAVEESFLIRNYGKSYGELYKPDSMSMGGGRGNGKDFDMDNWAGIGADLDSSAPVQLASDNASETAPSITDGQTPPALDGNAPALPEGGMQIPGGNGGMGGMGGDDVSLIYTDDNYSSYSNIWNNAKTDVSDADMDRLIASLKSMNERTDIEGSVSVESVIRYFVVHNFVVNFDSYTGSMIHNYYLYEKDGQLSMIPWDYNLAFGGFQSASDATSLVNYPIDSPVSGGTLESRPMIAWIFSSDEYTQTYHELFSELVSEHFESGSFSAMIDSVKAMISPYVEKDPTKFCTYDEFVKGIDTLKEFCLLRASSIRGQLNGTIGSTSEEQADRSGFVDADGLSVSDMGSMNVGMGGGRPSDGGDKGQRPNMPRTSEGESASSNSSVMLLSDTTEAEAESGAVPEGGQQMQPPSGGDFPGMNGGNGGNGGNWGQDGMQMPGGMQGGSGMMPSQGGSLGSANTGITMSQDILMLIVSVVVLAFGLIFATIFKRRK